MEANSIKGLDEFCEYLNSYTNLTHLSEVEYDDVVKETMNLSLQDLLDISPEECLARSIKLNSYAFWLQSELNSNNAKLLWCEESINHIVAKSYNNMPDMMKYEIRRHAIIKDNSFALELEKVRLKIKGATITLASKIEDIRNMSLTLRKLGESKAYR